MVTAAEAANNDRFVHNAYARISLTHYWQTKGNRQKGPNADFIIIVYHPTQMSLGEKTRAHKLVGHGETLLLIPLPEINRTSSNA